MEDMGNMARSERPITALTLGYRAHFVRVDPREPYERLANQGWPRPVLMFDTETATDAKQGLNFGSFAYGRWIGSTITVLRRGLFYADDLQNRYQDGYNALVAFHAKANRSLAKGAVEFELMSRESFVNDVLWKAYLAGALICGFNLLFDLSRIAIDCGEGRDFYYGGFSIPIWDYVDKSGRRKWHPYRPRLNAKPIDSKRALLGLSGTMQPQVGMNPDDVRGHLLDLKTLAFALTDRGHSLKSACEAFGATHQKFETTEHGVISDEYIRYNLQDVKASLSLLERLRAEFDRHPIALDPTRALSPAAVVKAYLREMKVTPPAMKFANLAPEYLGYAMTAYFGGRAEGHIRHTIVPVVFLDVLSMYPTVNTLLGNWWMLTAEELDVEDATDEVRSLLQAVTPERIFDPDFWRQLAVFVEVDADKDIVPVRAQYSERPEFSIGVNELHGATTWLALPDVVGSLLLTGRAPAVKRAFRLVPRGKQRGLQPVKLAGHTMIDPAAQDFFKTVIEARKRAARDSSLAQAERDRLDQFFKVLANSGGYGIFAEINPERLPEGKTSDMRLYGLGEPFEVKTRWPEDGGEFCFPPLASLITAGARLVLAALERCVTDLGGTYAFCDTDSMAIVATQEGGPIDSASRRNKGTRTRAPISALSFAQVDEIVQRFERLNPYDRSDIAGSVLKIEKENFVRKSTESRRQLYALVISAKRYVLFNIDELGEVDIRKASEHGLGHLLNPLPSDGEIEAKSMRKEAPNWIKAIWRYLIGKARGERVRRPEWFKLPAVSPISITTPQLLSRFVPDRRIRYEDRVKPFNFLLSAHVQYFGQSEDPATGQPFDPSTFHLVAPFAKDPDKWLEAGWIDRATGRSIRISTTANLSEPNVARVQSYGDVVDRYWVHPESKSAAADGTPCGPMTSGVLQRRAVRKEEHLYTTKEARRLEEVQRGDIHRLGDVLTLYKDEQSEWTSELLPALRSLKRSQAASLLGITERAVTELRQDRSRPSSETRAALRNLAKKGKKD
jgi:hypothetical protein